ncbi:hypothetical protein FIV42_06070 [Persicimonas caeni]|uniref:NnrS family protein n=1 Tax=Persicimonas caeni TaxID=2292766 RepID=A0A4Y6PQ30_PERCE|nr:hypothetical protein [Persicimonas caeni]QDG50313.1 hypothetical protein FIV42_06070 [Persicimonas caeni]QED31534.1 hypothetical protein FRD00_06065 [Persicimonas caeni]
MDPRTTHRWSKYWILALGCFVLAALAGTAFRVGFTTGALPFELAFDNVRRAHSHLMFFSWVTPALMALMVSRLDRRLREGFGRPMEWVLGANLVLGLCSFLPFALDGYKTTGVLGVEMPLSIIFSTASMFAWYAFAWLYWKRTRALRRDTTLALWDVAVVALVVSSIGAWARGALMGMGVEDVFLTDGAVHFFLGLFSDGWLGIALLGLVHDHLGVEMRGKRGWLTWLIVAGLPITFLLGMRSAIVPHELRQMAALGGLMVGVGFVGHTVVLWRARRARSGLWRMVLVFLGLKGLAQMLFIVPAVAAWAETAGLRIMYLHVLFLGAVSLGLVESARRTWGNVRPRHSRWMQAAVVGLLVTMLPTTGLWPPQLLGAYRLWIAAVGSLLPIAAAVWILAAQPKLLSTRPRNARAQPTDEKTRRSPLDDHTHGASSHLAASSSESSGVVPHS